MANKLLTALIVNAAVFSALFMLMLPLRKALCKRISPSLQLILWAVIALKLAAPFGFESSLSLLPAEPAAIEADQPFQTGAGLSGFEPIEAQQPHDAQQASENQPVQADTASVSEQQPAEAAAAGRTMDISMVLLGIWASGMLITGATLCTGKANLRRCVRHARMDIPERLLSDFDECKRELGIRRCVGLALSPVPGTPMVMGAARPVLVLPAGAAGLKTRALRHVLLHELAHVKRGDLWVTWLMNMLCAAYWFAPTVWLCSRLVRADIETACDHRVLRTIGRSERLSYISTVLQFTARRQAIGRLAVAMGMSDGCKTAKKRIAGMFRAARTGVGGRVVAAVVALMMLMVGVLTACQRTPEKPIVQNKADNGLNEAIAQTAAPAIPQSTDEPIPQPTKDHVSGSFTNASDTVTVNFDADVAPIAMSKIPVAQLEQTTIPADQWEKIVKAFFGDAKLYDRVDTKADIEARILKMQKLLTDDDALLKSDVASGSGSTDLDTLRKLEKQRIAEQQKMMKSAPDSAPEITSFKDGVQACVDLGNGLKGYVGPGLYAFGGEWPSSQSPRSLKYRFSTPIDLNLDDAGFQNAKQKAVQMIGDMGIEGVTLGKAYLSKDYTGMVEEGSQGNGISSDREFYVFCFERAVGEGSVAFNFIFGGMLNNSKSEEDYDRVLPYETIQIWMEGDAFRQFTWYWPMRVDRIINDNVSLAVDSKKAVELMKQQAFVQYVDANGYYSNVKVDVSGIDLELVRIKQRDTGNYLVVPAWVFHGQLTAAVTQKLIDKNSYYKDVKAGQYASAPELAHTISDIIMTINALDGSIIDQLVGY